MILDTGPIVAYFDADEAHHAWAVEQFDLARTVFQSCEAVVTEALFLLSSHPPAQQALLEWVSDGVLALSFHIEDQAAAVRSLMQRCQDVPMSLADACLVRLSELKPRLPVLTLDSHFSIYRRNKRDLIPVISSSRK